MSVVYSTEPATSGKVVLETTKGSVEIELWTKEMPLACRNFIQLCLEGYYNNTIFHRVIKGFMVQGGDPTGTGSGGASVYTDGVEGKYFNDEFHSRISFNRRGLIACANQSKANTNGSQFFITLGACKHLDKKHTIFGRIIGPTMFNVLQIENLEIGENDRPVYPPKIISTKIITNPFNDIKIRKDNLKKLDHNKGKKNKKKRKRVKNLGLLSFGGDEEEMDAYDKEINNNSGKKIGGIKSLHDAVNNKNLNKNKKKKKKKKTDTEEVEANAEINNNNVNDNNTISRKSNQEDKKVSHNDDNGNDNADHNIHMKTTTDDFIDHSGDKNIDTISNKNEKHDDLKQDVLLQTTGDTTGLVPQVVLTGDKREEWVEKQMDKFNNSSVDMDDW